MSVINGTSGNENLNGGSGDDVIHGGAGNDKISGGSGDDTLNGGSGSDTLNGGSGDDTLIYNLSENSAAGTKDVYTGGSGKDTVLIEFTLAQWLDAGNQAQIANYLQHLAKYTNAKTGEVSNGSASDFTFTFGGSTLTVQMIEKLAVTVDGVVLNPANEAVTARADVASVHEDAPSVVIDVLANDSVPDLVANLVVMTQPAHGTVQVETNDSANPAHWTLKYTATPGHWNYLAAGETAQETFTYKVVDANGDAQRATVTVTVTGSNDGPTAVADVADTDEDSSVTFAVLGNDSDPDASDVLSVTGAAISNGALGSVTVEADGQLTYDPGSAYNHLAVGESATVEITYQISDGHGGTSSAVATVTVTGSNDGPTAVADTAATDEDSSVTFGVLSNDSDPDTSDVLSVTGAAISNGALGSVTVEADGQLTYDPGSAYNHLAVGQSATVEITYQISDGHGGTASAVATVTVTGSNDGPTAVADTAATDEDSSVTFAVLSNDSDPDASDVLSVTGAAISNGALGSVTVEADGQLTYDPGSAYNHLAVGQSATVEITYQISDGHGGTASAVATVTVTGSNDGPTAVADTAAGTENQTLTIDVLANDSDVDDGHVFTLNAGSAPAGMGTVSVVGNQLVFDPGSDFDHLAKDATEVVTLSYEMQDEHGATSTSTVTVTITGTNDVPTVAAALSAAADEDDVGFTLDLLAGAADVDQGAVLSVTNVSGLVAGVTVAGSTLSVDPADASFQSLKLGQVQQIVVSYDVSDEHGASVAQTATITITGTNDVPTVAAALSAAADEDDVGFTVDLLAGAADVDQDAVLSVTNVSGLVAGVTVSGSTLSVDPSDASFQSLKLGQTQQIVVSYDVTDEHGASVAQTATITITGTNDVPVAQAAVAAVAEDASISGSVSATDADAGETAGLTYALVGAAPTGLTFNADGSYSFDASSYDALAEGEERVLTIPFTASDALSTSASTNLVITITGSNDTPTVAAALSAAADEDDGVFTLDLLAGAADVDQGALLSVSNVSGLVAGVTLSGSTLSVDPSDASFQSLKLGQQLQIVVGYDVTDEHGASVAQTATITITGSNDGATISGTATGDVVEDGVQTASGTLAVADVDSGENELAPVAAGTAGDNGYGSFEVLASGQWTYTLDNSLAAVQALPAGVTLSDSITVWSEDGTASQVITITITGTNDVPTVAAALSAAADEDDGVFTLDLLAGAADVDQGALLSVTNVSGLMAGVTLSGSTLSVDPGDAAFQSLKQGQQLQIVVGYDVTDEHGASVAQTATITITGTNDAPAITSDGAGASAAVSIPENTVAVTTITATDADAGAVLAYSIVGGADASRFTIDSTSGVLSFVTAPDFENPLDIGEDNVYDLVVAVSDGIDAATQALAVTVTNVNEGVAATDLKLVVTSVPSGNNLPSGAFARFDVVDPDGGAAHSFSLGGAGSASFALNATTGVLSTTASLVDNQTYALDVTVAQAGQGTYTESFRIVTGTNGNDTLAAASTDDAYFARNNTDIINAGDGDDTVHGQQGNDTISGGNGSDTLWGGGGNDTFVFNAGETGTDTIMDFNANATDLIRLIGFANIGSSGTLAAADFFAGAGAGAATVGAGVNVIYDSSTGTLYYDADGGGLANRTALAQITLDGGTFDRTDIVVGA